MANTYLCGKDAFYGAHQNNLNEDRPILPAAKCRSMILVSRNIKYMRIFAGVSQGWGVRRQRDCRRRRFLVLRWLLLRKLWPALSVVCRQRPTRKPFCACRGTAGCRCKIRYVSQFKAVLPEIARLSCMFFVATKDPIERPYSTVKRFFLGLVLIKLRTTLTKYQVWKTDILDKLEVVMTYSTPRPCNDYPCYGALEIVGAITIIIIIPF